jgi:hypothetical protein
MTKIRIRISNAIHNCVLHPVAGVLWLLGSERMGDFIHDIDLWGPVDD